MQNKLQIYKKKLQGKIFLDPEKNKIEKVKSKLIDACKSLIITVSDNDHPDIGYAPYIYKDNNFYNFIYFRTQNNFPIQSLFF